MTETGTWADFIIIFKELKKKPSEVIRKTTLITI